MPKKSPTKEQILQAAVCVVQQGGPSLLSVRHIASQLGCSTQPLYSAFGSFSQLQEELLTFIRQRYLTVRCTSYRGFAQAFLRFAAEEPELFRLLYLRRRNGEEKQLEDVNEERIARLLSKNLCMAPERARQMHRRMQAHCYGLGVMIATGYSAMSREEIDRELTEYFSIMLRVYKELTDETALTEWLVRSRHLTDDKEGFHEESGKSV